MSVHMHQCYFYALSTTHSSSDFLPPPLLFSYLNIYKDSYYCINYLLIYNLKDLYWATRTAGGE